MSRTRHKPAASEVNLGATEGKRGTDLLPGFELFAQVVETMEDGVSVQDRDLCVIYANLAHKKIFGEDIEGKHCYTVYEHRQEICPDCPVVECFRTGNAVKAVHAGEDTAGNPLHAEIVATPLRNQDGHIIAGIEVVRIVTEEVKTRQELQNKSDRLERLAAMSKEIASGLDLGRVLELVVVNAVELTGAGGGVVGLLDQDGKRIIYPYAYGVAMDISEISFPPGTGLVGQVMENREPVLLDDHTAYPAHLQILGDSSPKALLAVPLVIGERSVGSLVVFSGEKDKCFTVEDQQMAMAVADQAAVAIENARLFEETHERLRVRRELTRTAVSIASGLDLDRILAAVVRHAADIIKADAAMIAMLDEEEEVISFPYAYNLPEKLTKLTTKPGKALADMVIDSGSPRIVNDYQSFPDRRSDFAKAGLMAVATVPLRTGERTVGAIGVMDLGSGQQFVKEDIEILSIISRQAAVAVENARLYDKVHKSALQLEERVRDRTEALSRMYRESEQKSRELEEANAQLMQVDRLKSEFLANMSHELRTPLNAIIGFSKLVLDGLDGDINEEQERDLNIVHQNGMELLRLIDDLLDLARIEAGRTHVNINMEDPAELVNDVALSMSSTAESRGLMLDTQIPGKLEPVPLDRGKTRQIMMNLVNNAIKFTDEGSISLLIEQTPSETIFSVADTGRGLMPEEVEVIFDRFYQVSKDLADVDGVGLGLTLSKRFVELQGGRIWVESRYGKGSTFAFAIPNAG